MATSPAATTDGAVTSVAASATSVTLLAANSRARKRIIFNGGSTTLSIKLGSTAASASSFSVQLASNAAWELPGPLYCGAITGIWAGSPTGNALVTEY